MKKSIKVLSLVVGLLGLFNQLFAPEGGYQRSIERSREVPDKKLRFKSNKKMIEEAKRLINRDQKARRAISEQRAQDYERPVESSRRVRKKKRSQDYTVPLKQKGYQEQPFINIRLKVDGLSDGDIGNLYNQQKSKDVPVDNKEKSAEQNVKKAEETQKSLEEQISENIRERADFSWKHKNIVTKRFVGDTEAYQEKIRKSLDEYVDKISKEELGLWPSQRKELKLALSKGLMGKQEHVETFMDWAKSVTKLFGKGEDIANTVGDFAEKGKLTRGSDSRTYDYRSTQTRLEDVLTKEPLADLIEQLKLTPKQKERLKKYNDKMKNDPDYQSRVKWAERFSKYGLRAYKALNVAILVLIIGAIVEIVKNKDKIGDVFS